MGFVNYISLIIFLLPLVFALDNDKYEPELQLMFGKISLDTDDLNYFKESEVRFLLYTSNGDNGTVVNSNNIRNTTFNVSHPIKFTIHGFQGSSDDPQWLNIVKELLKYSEMNIIVVDWSQLADTWDYPLAISRSKKVAVVIGDFIVSLRNDLNITLSQVHVIGHSLGGQCAGLVGKNIIAQTGHKLSRISGLDPAGPLYEYPILVASSQHLTSDDAEFVDVIHVNKRVYGFAAPLGHADFYPNNGGPIQPGCNNASKSVSCSHGRCLDLYAESVNNNNFISYDCDSWSNFTSGECHNNTIARMGYHVTPNTRGLFYLYTNSEPPYAIGS